MYRSLTRLPLGFAGVSSLSRRRALTYASKHRAFPTTLYLTRVQLERKSELYDLAFNKPEWAYSDGMEVPKDGLVHPTINNRVCNGALLISNTHSMHELTDNAVTYYVDCLSSGQAPATEPHFLCIPKGTVIPESLTLFQTELCWFSLQPTHPMSLENLNKALTQFYYGFGRIYPLKGKAKEWMNTSPWGKAIWDATCDDEDEEKWMKQ